MKSRWLWRIASVAAVVSVAWWGMLHHQHVPPQVGPAVRGMAAPQLSAEQAVPRVISSHSLPPASSDTNNPASRLNLSLLATPDPRFDRDPDMGTPRFVRRRSGFLSDPAPGRTPEEIAAAFVESNGKVFTLHPTDIQPPNARLARDVTTRHNGMRSLTWQQQNDGIDIFRATFALNLTGDGRIINVQSRALHMPSVRFHDVVKVTKSEALSIASELLKGREKAQKGAKEAKRRKAEDGNGFMDTTDGKQDGESQVSGLRPPSALWYPLDQISVVKAWDLIVEQKHAKSSAVFSPPSSVHRLLIRADTGEVVEDMTLTWSAAEAATFNVYTNDSPEPPTPGPDTPTNGLVVEVTRTNVTLTAIDTNASPAGWVTAGQNSLVGNNARVYADWDDNDSPDGPAVTGTTYRVFDYPLDLLSGARSDYVEASQVQAFYVVNHFHDRLWQLGFDEAAGNFQGSNFGRGGVGGDALVVEVQNDYTAREGGVYGISAWYVGYGDGSVGRVSVNTSTMPPRKDGSLDAQVLIHEATHGLSTRLIGNGFGLTTTQSRGLAEGWSDFLPLALLSEPADDVSGTFPFGSYVGERFMQPQHLYFGIRRFPYSTHISKAPQTIADIDPNQIDFPAGVPMDDYYAADEADQIHNIGEVWCLMLWECRANLIEKLGFAGNETMLQLVVDGMKLSPVNPTFIEARDAILQADLVNNGSTNQIALWKGFAKRGLGHEAWVPGSVSTVGIVEDYGLPFTVRPYMTEVGGDGDGYVEPGENAELVVTLTSHEMGPCNIVGVLGREEAQGAQEFTITSSNAVLPDVGIGGVSTSAPPFAFTVSTNFAGNTDAQFSLNITSAQGAFDELLSLRIGNPYDYPPEIRDIAATGLSETNAWVDWNTGIPSRGHVDYGTTTNYGFATAAETVFATNHSIELPNMDKGTVYHYRVTALGTNGLTALSADHTFRTRARVYCSAASTATQELGTVAAPYKSLQAAAQAAKPYGDDILVAMGTYTSAQTEAVLDLSGSDWDLTIEGGYYSDFSLRDIALFVTTIDGQRTRRGIRLDEGAKLSISGMTITRGQGEWGGGVHVRKSEFSADECVIADNSSTNGINNLGGGVYGTLASGIAITDSLLTGNCADKGGALFGVSSGTVLNGTRCVMNGNTAFLAGGAGLLELGASGSLVSCQVADNVSVYAGGGIAILPFSDLIVEMSTFTDNHVSNAYDPESLGGGGISVAGSVSRADLALVHTIVVSNSSAYGADLRCGTKSEVHAVHCNIGDIYGSLTASDNVISVDPLFANPEVGDFHILYGSPCIDAGMTNYSSGTVDMDGEPRPFGTAIDIGADEFTDVDADNMADYWEVAKFGSTATTDGTNDTDGDLLNDFGEYINQTDPHDSDTDNDLAQDGWEVGNGYNPLDRDMDNDGMWDGWEANHALNAFSNDAALNPDGDPHDNLSEFTADTDPHDSNSILRLLYVGNALGGRRLDWQGGVNAWQYLEVNTNLVEADGWEWIFAFPPPRPITNAIVYWGETNKTLFYRIRAERE